MHELTVTQNVLDIALRYAEANDATRISTVNLVVGQLASIVDDCVQFYWDIISKDTIAQGAMLHFERVPAQFHCDQCERCYRLDESELICPACGSSRVTLIAGDAFYIDSIEVEQ